ncbi:MAG TPA: penicillin-binding protein 2 [Acidimicrobiia bacterium]|nr:penicillin-binding protein 2 [Acidimicrobiia bacterium]
MTEGSRVRLGIVAVVVVALFSALFTRLWFLQVVQTSDVAAAVQTNSVRTVRIAAPRGEILDRNGIVIADNAVVNAITMRRNLDAKQRDMVVGRLAELLKVTPQSIAKSLDDPRVSPYTPVPVAVNVGFDQLAYVKEHHVDFPGVDAVPLAVRRYHAWGNPALPIAPHLVGYVGEINDVELKDHANQGYALGDTIGKSGVEQAYEADLRGTPGYEKLEVDNRGRVQRVIARKDPLPGHNVVLTIDVTAQITAEESLLQAMAADRAVQDKSVKDHEQFFKAPAGSVVVLDARNGSVVAMASEPDFDPNAFVNGIPTATWKAYNDPASYFPLTNRAVQGLYAPGSTFKPVSATAMLQSGFRSPTTPFNDTGSLKLPDQTLFNDQHARYGQVNLARALTVSSDVYFYTVGQALSSTAPAGGILQQVARSYGFGSPTGIALSGEARGRVPDPAWKKRFNDSNPDPVAKAQNSRWYPGDNINLAVGQGDLLVTPLQLASAYTALADNGTQWVPRIVDHVTDAQGKLVRTVQPVQKGSVPLPPGARDAIMQGLTGVVNDPKGTAYGAFQGFPLTTVPVAGKTGTAQVQGKEATSVFAAITFPDAPQYVAVSFVEEAGYGAAVSAPIVRRVLEGVYGIPPQPPPPVQVNPQANNGGN